MRIGFIDSARAGALYAAAAAAHGDTVSGYDPAAPSTPEGVERTADLAGRVLRRPRRRADGASLSERIAADAAPHLGADAVYADFTTASPEDGPRSSGCRGRGRPLRRRRDPRAGAHEGRADRDDRQRIRRAGRGGVAVGPRRRGRADRRAGRRGDPRKLLRSVLMKSLAAVVVEAVTAGRAAGCEPWVREQIAAPALGRRRGEDRPLRDRQPQARRPAQPRDGVRRRVPQRARGAVRDVGGSERVLQRLADEEAAAHRGREQRALPAGRAAPAGAYRDPPPPAGRDRRLRDLTVVDPRCARRAGYSISTGCQRPDARGAGRPTVVGPG